MVCDVISVLWIRHQHRFQLQCLGIRTSIVMMMVMMMMMMMMLTTSKAVNFSQPKVSVRVRKAKFTMNSGSQLYSNTGFNCQSKMLDRDQTTGVTKKAKMS